MRWLMALAAAALASWQVTAAIAAQDTYPTRTVRFILPYGAASATDIAARMFADRLSKLWGKPVVVENRPGGDGLVSLNAFVAAHDEHALWFGPAGAFNVLPYQQDALPFDPAHDISPIVSISDVALAITVPSSMKINTVGQFAALAKAKPGRLNAAAANGISDFLLFGFFKKAGLDVVHVPYRDIMQAPNDLAESRIEVLASSLAVVQPLAAAGRLKVLVVTSSKRVPNNPDIPTAAEAGVPELAFDSLGGIFGPSGMSEAIRNKIAADIRKVADSDPAIGQRLATTGQIMTILGPAEFDADVQHQRDRLADLAKILGLKKAR